MTQLSCAQKPNSIELSLRAELDFANKRLAFYQSLVRDFQWNMLALGDNNRYFASLKLGRPATDEEAYWHFILNGGKDAFDKAHPKR